MREFRAFVGACSGTVFASGIPLGNRCDAFRPLARPGRLVRRVRCIDYGTRLGSLVRILRRRREWQQQSQCEERGARHTFPAGKRPKFGAAVSCPASMMPRRIARVRVK